MVTHKQGEHVFNNFVKVIENTKDAVVKEVRTKFPAATKSIFEKSYRAHIGHIENHPHIAAGRQLKASPSGNEIDMNSQRFGAAAHSFQTSMCDLARNIVHGLGNPDRHIGAALSAWKQMADAGIDPLAYQSLLASKRQAQRSLIEQTHLRMMHVLQQDFPLLGRDVVRTIADDVQEYVRNASRIP